MKKLLVAALLILNILHASAQKFTKPLQLSHPELLQFVDINGLSTAYYELIITNLSADTVQLKALTIYNTRDSIACFQLDEQALKTNTRALHHADNNAVIPPRQTVMAYIELGIRKNIHRIFPAVTYAIAHQPTPQDFTINSSAAICFMQLPVVIGKPLREGAWAAVYEPSWDRGHRRVVYTVDGKSRIPGRYAIDFIMLNEQGQFATGDPNLVNQWLGYGADVLAVADGEVSSVRTDFTESKTLDDHAAEPAERATGNYVSIKLNNQQLAFYEHLMPNSIKVKVGQKVKKGQVIGKVGFTGQTTGPHLHFHLADIDSPLGAEGLPFIFESFDVLGSYPDFEQFGKAPWRKTELQPATRFQERPAPNFVVRFK